MTAKTLALHRLQLLFRQLADPLPPPRRSLVAADWRSLVPVGVHELRPYQLPVEADPRSVAAG